MTKKQKLVQELTIESITLALWAFLAGAWTMSDSKVAYYVAGACAIVLVLKVMTIARLAGGK